MSSHRLEQALLHCKHILNLCDNDGKTNAADLPFNNPSISTTKWENT